MNQRQVTPADARPQALAQAIRMIQSGQANKTIGVLYQYGFRNEFASYRVEARYWLGVALTEMQFPQLAAVQFVEVIRSGKSNHLRPAIDKLSILADRLGDETLLNYALSKVMVSDLPAENRDLLYFRLGENNLRQARFQDAMTAFERIGAASKSFFLAQYNRGLALLEANRPKEAIPVFQNLLSLAESWNENDLRRVSLNLALARSHYQAQEWDQAIEFYRKIPRDNPLWSQSLFEVSWAYFRAAKFRSAMSQFHSLHSPFYEENYQPESLLLRSLVYLYICQFDEMEKTLGVFEKSYGTLLGNLQRFLNQNRDPILYAEEILKDGRKANVLPLRLVRYLQTEGDVRRSVDYIKKIAEERQKVSTFGGTVFAQYARKALEQRNLNARRFLGELVQVKLKSVQTELEDLIEQAAFAKYEMTGGRKELLKKKISGQTKAVDDNLSRSYFVENGFEYWPSSNEYWLNELGSFQYVGKSSCE